MDKNRLGFLAQKLQGQRAALFKELSDTEAGLRSMAEDRESELEERAQEERAAGLLARLDNRGRRELEELDAALERIAKGNYGKCERCGRAIRVARLQALPATRFCVRCAAASEKGHSVESEEETPRSGKVPGDMGCLTDRELEAAIREAVKGDARLDTQELRILCRRGVVFLTGALPSEAEHRILLHILTDVMGLRDVVDHVQVKELLWEREDRTRRQAPEEFLPREEPRGTEDIVESSEDGVDYAPPADPTPDEE